MSVVVLIVLVLLVIGSLPTWPYSRAWGHRGSGLLGILLLVFLALLLLRAIAW